MEITDKNFIDWESTVFGYGYGTGEEFTLKALIEFFNNCFKEDSILLKYDYEIMETKLGSTVAWLMINILAKANIIEYGTSPRYGWLTKAGEFLYEYVKTKNFDELYDIVMSTDEDYDYCYPDHCECDKGIDECNPLFNRKYF